MTNRYALITMLWNLWIIFLFHIVLPFRIARVYDKFLQYRDRLKPND